MRLRSNFVSGVTNNNPLSPTDTVLTSDDIDLPELVAGYNYYPLILDPGEVNGDMEVVYVTEHADGATPSDTAVIVRGKEGTTARTHPLNTNWVHAPTKLDGINYRIEHAIDYPKHTADTGDDDFDGQSLDAKWTVIDGTEGSVLTPLTTPATSDVFEVDDGMTLQHSNSTYTAMYQVYTLPVGKSLIAKFMPNVNTTNTGGPDSNCYWAAFQLTDNTSALWTDNHIGAHFYAGSEDTWLGQYGTTTTWSGNMGWYDDDTWMPGSPLYMRIARTDTLDYVTSFSHGDGRTWNPCQVHTAAAEMTHIHMRVGGTETDGGTPVVTSKWDWVREYDNSMDDF